jgi:Mg-chelatase subunit ChlI
VEEHNKYFAELYARVFSTLAAYDTQSKISTHDVDRSDTDEIMSTRSKDKYIAELYTRVFSTLAAYKGQSKFSTHDVDRSDTDEMSQRRRQEATPTRSPSSRPLTSTRSKDKYFAELYARFFSTLAANGGLGAR